MESYFSKPKFVFFRRKIVHNSTNFLLCFLRYLERQFSSLIDPYEVAIVTYALTLCDSGEKDLAFRVLSSMVLNGDGSFRFFRLCSCF